MAALPTGSREVPLLSSPLKLRGQWWASAPRLSDPQRIHFLFLCAVRPVVSGQGEQEAEREEGRLPVSGEMRPWLRSHRKPPTGSSEGLRGGCVDPRAPLQGKRTAWAEAPGACGLAWCGGPGAQGGGDLASGEQLAS